MSHLVPASWGGEATGENRALTLVLAGDGGVIGVATLLKASLCNLWLLTCAAPGETPDLDILDLTMTTFWRHSTS
jgi:hypothetical protein